MPLISKIGRKAPASRALIGSIYVALLLGAVSMVYPFLLMISGSTKSGVDDTDFSVIPGYLKDDEALYRKECEAFFNENSELMKMAFGGDATTFKTVALPSNSSEKMAADWQAFLKSADLPYYAYTLGYLNVMTSGKCQPYNLRAFKSTLIDKYDGDLQTLNSEMDTYYDNWSAFHYLPESYLIRRDTVRNDPIDQAFRAFKENQPKSHRYYFSIDGYFRNVYLKSQYTQDIEGYNAEHGTSHRSWDSVVLSETYPADAHPNVRKDWQIFVRDIVCLLWIRPTVDAAKDYQNFLEAKYGTLAAVNKIYESNHESFSDIPLPVEPPMSGVVSTDWTAFVQGWKNPVDGKLHQLKLEHIKLNSIDTRFRDYLKTAYGSLDAANAAWETSFSSWQEILPPQEALHLAYFQTAKGELRTEFTIRNYVSVIDFIALHGRAIWNTAIYCGLAILTALLVNPLAAYALSRYKPPSAYKVLLFLMLTMAFPPLVTMIPQFLMLREFGMLNTFAALVLPGMANGYSIFLLKGFFDSLPQELYESAEIDGAGEFRIFWTITMSLSTPILAVIALNAFNMAYSNFMMALLICQDQDMWTLMPWLFQLQQGGCQGVVFSSLLIAAIPTFLIFVFCQNIIMRGIVVPVEK